MLQRGIEQGIERGELQGKLVVALNLRSRGFTVLEIASILDLPLDVIEKNLNQLDA